MWVVSQDKKRLQNFNGFTLEIFDSKYYINGWVNDWSIQIGRYNTMQRVFDILKDLQYHAETIEHNKMYYGSSEEQYAFQDSIIFKMPES